MAFPGPSSSSEQVLGQCTLSRFGGGGCLITSPVPAAWLPGCTVGAPLRCAMCLLWELISGYDPPGRCHPYRMPGRLGWQLGAYLQFGRGCHLWGWVCPLTSGSGCHQTASLPPVGDGPVWPASSPLVFTQSFVLWVAWQYLRLGLFAGKFSLSLSFFFLSMSGYPTVRVAISG